MLYQVQCTDICELVSMCIAVNGLSKEETVFRHPKGPGLQNGCYFPDESQWNSRVYAAAIPSADREGVVLLLSDSSGSAFWK